MNGLVPSRLILAACLGLGLCLAADGQLADTSPFLPPGTVDGGLGTSAGGSLELRGIMSTSDGMRFCIYDASRKSSSWVALNESGHGYVVKSSDAAKDTVTLQADGRTYTLALRASKISPMAMPPMTLPAREMAAQQNFVPSISAADEAKRLEAIAAEVRRRRLLREQVDQAQDRALGIQNGGRPPQ
jgi:hypothetical protein